MKRAEEEIKNKIHKLNKDIKEKYNKALNMENNQFKTFLEEYIGEIKLLDKLDLDELSNIEKKGGVVGIDGSVNKKGGAYPHYIEIYKALAKSTKYKDNPVIISNIYTPVTLDYEEEIKDIRSQMLASIEIEAGIKSIEEHKPYAIIMDGGLIRYNIEAGDKWEYFTDLCIKNNVLLVGVIKDIKTSLIGKELEKRNIGGFSKNIYDRELLYGKLDYKEALFIKGTVNTKDPEGYQSAFMRSAKSPDIIGIDILDDQKHYLYDLARLILSLTPENSRGVPLWLDIVDEEVKVSDEYMKGILEEYLDRNYYERFFISERDKRN